MALPSGTTISADDINTYIGRTSGTAVNWNTTVRTLSNTTTATPDLDGTRGRYSRAAFNTSGYSADLYASQTNYNSVFTNAFNIPGTPWRLIARGYPNSTSGNALEICIVGTGLTVNNVYSLTGASAINVGHPTTTVYPGCDYNMAMLENGKFVIAYSLSNQTGQWFGYYGLGFTILTFNNNGTIASSNNYFTKLASSLTGAYGTDAYLLYNRRENREMSTFVNKCSFTLNTAGQKWLTVTLDGTNTNPSIQYTLVSNNDTSNVTSGGSVNSNVYQGGITPIVYYDGSMSVVRSPLSGDEAVLNSKLNAAGNAWANPGTRHATSGALVGSVPWFSIPSANYPTNGYVLYCINLVNGGTQNVFIDNSLSHSIRNYFISRDYYSTCSNIQVSGSPYAASYFSGNLTGITIQKINATDNAIKYTIGIAMRGPYYFIDTPAKSGVTTTFYPYTTISTRSLVSVRTDSSDNTYYLVRIVYIDGGGQVSSTYDSARGGAISGYGGSYVPIYTLIKVDSGGNLQWYRSFDIGPFQTAKSAFIANTGTTDGDLSQTRATFSILLREEINQVEVYATYGVAESTATPFAYQANKFAGRALMFRASDGYPSFDITSANNSLGVINLPATKAIAATSGVNVNVSFFAPKVALLTNATATSNSTNYSSSSTWTETLSPVNAAIFTQSPTTVTTGLTIVARYAD